MPDPDAENMQIHGDNLPALKALESKYVGQVKHIYIDPPYNANAAARQYDDNIEHSRWLSLMMPRLELLRQLLSAEGSLWISMGNENSFLFVTTRHLSSAYLDSIKDTMEKGEYLIIAYCSFDSGLDKAYDGISIKKIPQMLLERCEFGKTAYNLNLVHPLVYDGEEKQDV